MKVSVLIITHNRISELEEALTSLERQHYTDFETIVIDNGSTNKEEIRRVCDKFSRVSLMRSETNLGVAGGRNFGFNYCVGDIIINLDDDAEISGPLLVEQVANIFKSNQKLAIIPFKIVNYFTGKVDKKEFSGKDLSLVDKEFFTSYFCGGANAIRKQVLEEIGGYEEKLFYGGEELFVAHQAINLGYVIFYSPELLVYHKTSPTRMPNKEYFYFLARNRLWICAQLIPFPYVITNLFIWTSFGIYRSLKAKALHCYIKGLIDGCHGLSYFLKKRQKYTERALIYLKNYQGRLWY